MRNIADLVLVLLLTAGVLFLLTHNSANAGTLRIPPTFDAQDQQDLTNQALFFNKSNINQLVTDKLDFDAINTGPVATKVQQNDDGSIDLK